MKSIASTYRWWSNQVFLSWYQSMVDCDETRGGLVLPFCRCLAVCVDKPERSVLPWAQVTAGGSCALDADPGRFPQFQKEPFWCVGFNVNALRVHVPVFPIATYTKEISLNCVINFKYLDLKVCLDLVKNTVLPELKLTFYEFSTLLYHH